MLLSSCVVWRHATFEGFREDCPDGDETLAAAGLGALRRRDPLARAARAEGRVDGHAQSAHDRTAVRPAVADRRARPRGRRLSATGRAMLASLDEPLILATGGFPVRLAHELGLPVRSNPWSEGDGLDFVATRGAATAGDLSEFYGRPMPAPPARYGEDDYVRLAQLYGDRARAVERARRAVLRRAAGMARERPRAGDRAAARRHRGWSSTSRSTRRWPRHALRAPTSSTRTARSACTSRPA